LTSVDVTDLGLEYAGATLVYLSETTLRIYYKITNESLYDTAKANGLLTDINEAKKSSGFVFFEFANIPAAELANFKTFSIGGTECNYTALNYAKSVLSSSAATTKQRELAKATYRYYVAAKAYFG